MNERQNINITIVGCCYYLSPKEFTNWLEKQARASKINLAGVIVCNNPKHSTEVENRQIKTIPGTNDCLDYSGYFEGLDYVLKNNTDPNPKAVLFVNDSLITKHCGSLILKETFKHFNLATEINCPAMVGKADEYFAVCLKNPWSQLNKYISSYCFILNNAGIEVFRQLTELARQDNVLPPHRIQNHDWGNNIEKSFGELIRAHLVYKSSPFYWPGQSGFNDEEVIRKKALCCYYEHKLSGLIGLKGALIPVNAGSRSRLRIWLGEQIAAFKRAVKKKF